jgi:hypothetical protein
MDPRADVHVDYRDWRENQRIAIILGSAEIRP